MKNFTLTRESQGNDVHDLKNKLHVLDYRISNINNYFDEETKIAIESFQNDYGLIINGNVDSQTWLALDNAYLQRNPSAMNATVNIAQTRPTLRLDYTNAYVTQLQNGLKKLGYLNGPADSIFGNATAEAVLNFQKANNLLQDGVVGTKTWEALDRALADQSTTPPPSNPSSRQTLRRGSRGLAVLELQEALRTAGFFKGNPDGIFGAITEDSVKSFQKSRNLTVDGIVGAKTWEALENAFSANPLIPEEIEPVLEEGSTGDFVKLLQTELNKLGLYSGAIDGNFGKATTEAVKKFQNLNGIVADGVVGSTTWDLLDTVYAGLPINLPIIKEGSTGESVEILQEKLLHLGYYTGSVTGSFGYETTIAVKAFQKDNGIIPDGVVGAKTWQVLYEKTKVDIPIAPLPGGPKPTIRQGDKGKYVGELQRELTALLYYEGPINQIFDYDTLVAVKSFQDANGLTPDGIVGRSTWYSLYSVFPPPVVCD